MIYNQSNLIYQEIVLYSWGPLLLTTSKSHYYHQYNLLVILCTAVTSSLLCGAQIYFLSLPLLQKIKMIWNMLQRTSFPYNTHRKVPRECLLGFAPLQGQLWSFLISYQWFGWAESFLNHLLWKLHPSWFPPSLHLCRSWRRSILSLVRIFTSMCFLPLGLKLTIAWFPSDSSSASCPIVCLFLLSLLELIFPFTQSSGYINMQL